MKFLYDDVFKKFHETFPYMYVTLDIVHWCGVYYFVHTAFHKLSPFIVRCEGG
jgi:hypothetical protein